MATITLEVPNEISVPALESKIMHLAKSMGLDARYGGHRRIKLMHSNPNAVTQHVRRIPILRDVAATPGLMDSTDLRRIPPLSSTLDDLAVLDRSDGDDHEEYALAPQLAIEKD